MLLSNDGPDVRAAILKLWDQKQDTDQIGKLINRQEWFVESQLHIALDVRRSVRNSLGPK